MPPGKAKQRREQAAYTACWEGKLAGNTPGRAIDYLGISPSTQSHNAVEEKLEPGIEPVTFDTLACA
jgi:hypothetical protein